MKRGRLFERYRVDGAVGFGLIDRLKSQKIGVYDLVFGQNATTFSTDSRDSKKFFAISSNMCYNITRIKYYGKVSPVKFLAQKIGLVLAFSLFFGLAIFFDGYITKISYLGDGEQLRPVIVKVLNENEIKEKGFLKANLKDLSGKILSCSDEISFVSCKKRGRELIIEAYKKTFEAKPIETKKKEILSTAQGTVKRINCLSGTVLVEVGQKVQKGEALIGGFYLVDEEKRESYALGEVEIIAEFNYTYEAFSSGDKYKNRAIALAKEELGQENILEIQVKEKKVKEKIVYTVKVFYTLIVS